MGTLLLTILGDIIAGVVVYGITEGSSRSGGNQTVIIENAYFGVPEFRGSSRSSSSGSGTEGIWLIFIAIFVIYAMIVTALVKISAIYVQNINTILFWSYYPTIIFSILGGVLLIIGIFQSVQSKDWSIVQVAFYSLVLCAIVGGLVWLIYSPSHAPDGYENMVITLQNLDLKDDNWASKAPEIGTGDEFFSINPVIKFLSLQALGVVPLFFTIILIAYIQIKLAWVVYMKENGNFSLYTLVVPPILATISALCLGVIGK